MTLISPSQSHQFRNNMRRVPVLLLASADPAPPPVRRNSERRLLSLSQVPVHHEGAYTTGRGTDGDEAVSEEHTVESPHWQGIGARLERSSAMHNIQEGVIPTTYFTHADAGEVRVVELPPPYNELQFQSTQRA